MFHLAQLTCGISKDKQHHAALKVSFSIAEKIACKIYNLKIHFRVKVL